MTTKENSSAVQSEESKRWEFIRELDERLLLGGVILSEWVTFLVRDADTAYCAQAPLAAILASQAGIEAHLRYEYGDLHSGKALGFYDLIEQSPLPAEVKKNLHSLRKFRNRWVHVRDPHDDEALLNQPEVHEAELDEMARFAIEQLHQVTFREQGL